MYCVYKTNDAWLNSQFVNDIKLLATGTADVNNLSASCNKASTTITNTIAAGWTLCDDAAGTNAKVISCSDADAVTTKYLRLDGNSSTLHRFRAYEAWNATSHTGSVGSYDDGANAVAMSINIGAANFFYVWITPAYLIIRGYHSGSWQGYIASFELDRTTAASDFYSNPVNNKGVHFVAASSSQYMYMPTIKKAEAAGTGNAAGLLLDMGASYPPRNISESTIFPIWKPIVKTYSYSSYMGCVKDLYSTASNGASALDELTINGNTYQATFSRDDQLICARKG